MLPNIAGSVAVGWARGNLITYLVSGSLHERMEGKESGQDEGSGHIGLVR